MRRLVSVAILAFAGMATIGFLVRGQPAPVESEVHTALLDGDLGWLGTVTHLGDTLVIFALALIAAVLLRANPRSLAIPLAAVLGWFSYTGLKVLFDRARPADRLWAVGGDSYPSGHATMSATMAIATVAVIWPTVRGWRRWLAVVVATAFAAVVGYTRVASGVHWPTDIIGGWFTAAGCTAVALLVISARRV